MELGGLQFGTVPCLNEGQAVVRLLVELVHNELAGWLVPEADLETRLDEQLTPATLFTPFEVQAAVLPEHPPRYISPVHAVRI